MALHGMQLVFHGGKCCGIKTIYGLGYGSVCTTATMSPLEKIPRDDTDQGGGSVNSDKRFFHEEAPKENATERLDRYIAYMKKRRPGNLLEVVLAWPDHKDYEYMSQEPWVPVLLERGFKEVARQLNSNSGNICAVFYLNIDEEWPGKEKSRIADDDCDDDYDPDDDDDADPVYCDCGCGIIL